MKILKLDSDGSSIAIPESAMVRYIFERDPKLHAWTCRITVEAPGIPKFVHYFPIVNDVHRVAMSGMLDDWLTNGGNCAPHALYELYVEPQVEVMTLRQKTGGFTVIELLTVVAILIIFGTLIVSALHRVEVR